MSVDSKVSVIPKVGGMIAKAKSQEKWLTKQGVLSVDRSRALVLENQLQLKAFCAERCLDAASFALEPRIVPDAEMAVHIQDILDSPTGVDQKVTYINNTICVLLRAKGYPKLSELLARTTLRVP